MEKHPDNLGIALDAHEKGIVAIPMHRGTKVPMVKWKEWQQAMPPVELLRQWFRGACNIAILTTGMVVYDCETLEKVGLVVEKCGETCHMLKTPGGGVHLGYRRRRNVAVTNKVKIKGLDIDIRTDGGLEMIPNSFTEKGRYEWLGQGLRPISELPYGNVGWTRERSRKRIQTAVIEEPDRQRHLLRARAYLAKIEPAESGHGGHNKTFSTACKLAKFVNYDAELLWVLLLEYNARCLPPWDERALRHKFEDALKRK